jgi:hypothetical protein
VLTVRNRAAASIPVAAIRRKAWPTVPSALLGSGLLDPARPSAISRPVAIWTGWPTRRVPVGCREGVRPYRAEVTQPVVSLSIRALGRRRLAILPPPAHYDLHTNAGNAASAHRELAMPVRSNPTPVG